MTSTYEPIATTTLSAGTASVTFSSIPQTYTDVVWIIEGISTANAVITVQFNADTTNYSCTYLNGNGTSAASARDTTGYIYIGNPSLSRFNIVGTVLNYTNATTYKTYLSRSNTAASQVAVVAGLWRGTPAAITSIKFLNSNFDTTTTFTLYGIKAE